MIGKVKSDGNITGIKGSPALSFSHLLFIDDAILFGLTIVEEWKEYKNILDFFCVALGMRISMEKTSFLTNNIS